jgi:hypothetical protein
VFVFPLRISFVSLALLASLTKLREPVPRINCVRVSFGVLSISQPGEGASQRELPGFVGFYGVFLELRQNGVALEIYWLWLEVGVGLGVVWGPQMHARSPVLE